MRSLQATLVRRQATTHITRTQYRYDHDLSEMHDQQLSVESWSNKTHFFFLHGRMQWLQQPKKKPRRRPHQVGHAGSERRTGDSQNSGASSVSSSAFSLTSTPIKLLTKSVKSAMFLAVAHRVQPNTTMSANMHVHGFPSVYCCLLPGRYGLL